MEDDSDDRNFSLAHTGVEDSDDSWFNFVDSEGEDEPDTKLHARLCDVYEISEEGRKKAKVYCDAGSCGILQIAFYRTIRVPNNDRTYELPPCIVSHGLLYIFGQLQRC